MHLHVGIGPVEPILLVTDVTDRHAAEMRQQLRRNGIGAAGLTGQHDAIGRDQSLTRHAGVGIGGQEGVEDGIAQAIRDLVGVAFGNGLGGK